MTTMTNLSPMTGPRLVSTNLAEDGVIAIRINIATMVDFKFSCFINLELYSGEQGSYLIILPCPAFVVNIQVTNLSRVSKYTARERGWGCFD